MNCFIYIKYNGNINGALAYLQMRSVPYKCFFNTSTAEFEISSSEKYSKILDNCAKRFS